MALFEIKKLYPRADFVALVPGPIPLALFRVHLLTFVWSVPIINVDVIDAGLVVQWAALPSTIDDDQLDDAVATFVGGTTTSQPFVYNSFAVATSTSSTPVVKINETTPALDEGTYQVSWTSSIRMQAVIANTGVEAKIRLTRSDGAFVEQDDAWALSNRHAYNGSMPFPIAAGQTVTALLTFSRLGASGTAEMSGARITIDKVS
jgi:hypothetical protein